MLAIALVLPFVGPWLNDRQPIPPRVVATQDDAGSIPKVPAPSTAPALREPSQVPSSPNTPTPAQRWAAVAEELHPLWDRNWDKTIAILKIFLSEYPDHTGAIDKLYAAHDAYGQQLLQAGNIPGGVAQIVYSRSLRGESIRDLLANGPEHVAAARRAYTELWLTRKPVLVKRCMTRSSEVVSITFQSRDTVIGVLTHDGVMSLWQFPDCRQTQSLAAGARHANFSVDGSLLATATGDGVITVWNLSTGGTLPTAPQYSSGIRGRSILGFTNSNRGILAMMGNSILEYSLINGNAIGRYDVSLPYGRYIDGWSRSGDLVTLTPLHSHSSYLINIGDPGYMRELLIDRAHYGGRMSPDQKVFSWFGCEGNKLGIGLTSLPEGKTMNVLVLNAECPRGYVLDLEFSPDGRLLASSDDMQGSGSRVLVWNGDDGRVAWALEERGARKATALSWTDDGRMVAFGRSDGWVEVWEPGRR